MNLPQSIAGIIFTPDRKSVLLIKRRDVPVWVLPGGGIEQGESPQQAIVREILEETGFTVKVDRFIGDYLPINRLAKRTYLYECKVYSGSAKLTEETRGIAFFPTSKLPAMPPPYSEWIQDALMLKKPVKKKLNSVNYLTFFKYLLLHPILISRFILARCGLSINSKPNHKDRIKTKN